MQISAAELTAGLTFAATYIVPTLIAKGATVVADWITWAFEYITAHPSAATWISAGITAELANLSAEAQAVVTAFKFLVAKFQPATT